VGRVDERRRKRMLLPAVYLMAEIVVIWLALALVQLKFSFMSWSLWSMLIFVGAVTYAVIKTIHVYKRQKDYLTVKEFKKYKIKR